VLTLDVATRTVTTVAAGLSGWVCDPLYARNGRSLLVNWEADHGRGQMALVDLATGRLSRVLESPYSDTGASVGPDGDALAFVRSKRLRATSMGGSRWCDADVWIGSLNRGGWRQLTHRKAEAASHPQFSPDGKRLYLAFHSIDDSDVYTVALPTGATKKLTKCGEYTTDPAVSPDGGTVVFVSDHVDPLDHGSIPLWRMRPDGSRVERIVAPVRRWQGPRFFPDGRSVVCWVDAVEPTEPGEVWRIYLNGRGHVRLY